MTLHRQIKTNLVINDKLANVVSFKDSLPVKNSIYLDIRSPREFDRGHATKSCNIPLFSNNEFSDIGFIYKSKGKQEAVDRGLLYASRSISTIMKKVKLHRNKTIFVYCARGGMRSDAFVWLLDSLGYKVYKILGGYKSIRHEVLNSFGIKNKIIVLGGGTGTGKTIILSKLEKMGCNIIDLEAFANHRGSSFGSLGLGCQPTQQQFENNLYFKIIRKLNDKKVFIESESRKIGKLIIPEALWLKMEAAKYIKISMQVDRRIANLIDEYGHFEKENLEQKILNIKKKLGGENVKAALSYVSNAKKEELCRLLLKCYYDKVYSYSFEKRKNEKMNLVVNSQSFRQIAKQLESL